MIKSKHLIAVMLSWLALPYYLTFLSWMYFLRKAVFTWLNIRYGKRLVPLGSSDIYWTVGEKYHNLINVVMTINVKDPNEDLVADIREVINERVLSEPDKYKKLLCSLNTFLGYSFLLVEKVKADNFITVIDVEKTKYKSMKDLYLDYSFKPLPLNNKLLFEIIVVKAPREWKAANDFEVHQIPMLIRINHSVADGLSVMNFCAHTLGENDINLEGSLKNIPKSPEWQRIPVVQFWQKVVLFLLVPGFILLQYIGKEFEELSGKTYQGPMSSFRQRISYRTEKPGEGLVQRIKLLKNQIGDTSFSEIILTAISAAMSKYYEKSLFKVPKSIRMAIVATKDLEPLTVKGVPQLRNQFGMVDLDIPIKIESNTMTERLKVLKKSSRELYKDPTELLIRTYINFNLLKFLPLPVIKRVLPLNGIASVISNLPEFPKIIVFNGHEVEDAYFFTLERDQMATGFAVISYDHRVHLGFSADVASVPTQEDCDEIVNDFFKSIDVLQLEVNNKKLNLT